MAATGAGMLGATRVAPIPAAASPFCLFSKHLPELNWSDLGRAVKDTGFEGVDLTVRGRPRVARARPDDLPRAIDAISRRASLCR